MLSVSSAELAFTVIAQSIPAIQSFGIRYDKPASHSYFCDRRCDDREVFVFGFSQVFITGALFAVSAVVLFDINYKTAIIAGAGLALSSTAIVLKILNETGKIKDRFGRSSLGILIFQDIAVIPILLMITLSAFPIRWRHS